MKNIVTVLTLSSTLTLSACSLFAPKTQTISAACSEPDATLQINGQLYKGSAQAEVRRDKTVAIMCVKSGYFPAQRSIDYSLSGTGVADIVGTLLILIPGIGLFSPGAWTLDETYVTIPMLRDER